MYQERCLFFSFLEAFEKDGYQFFSERNGLSFSSQVIAGVGEAGADKEPRPPLVGIHAVRRFRKNLRVVLPYDPAIPLPGICRKNLETLICEDTRTPRSPRHYPRRPRRGDSALPGVTGRRARMCALGREKGGDAGNNASDGPRGCRAGLPTSETVKDHGISLVCGLQAQRSK